MGLSEKSESPFFVSGTMKQFRVILFFVVKSVKPGNKCNDRNAEYSKMEKGLYYKYKNYKIEKSVLVSSLYCSIIRFEKILLPFSIMYYTSYNHKQSLIQRGVNIEAAQITERYNIKDAMGVLFSYLDEAIDDMENGRVYSKEEVFAELDVIQ